jgi:hemoglobin/transferrin/lactoferrin receptor protein
MLVWLRLLRHLRRSIKPPLCMGLFKECWLLLLLFTCGLLPGTAQIIHVYDLERRTPVVGATAFFFPGGQTALSDESGSLNMMLPELCDRVLVEHPDYPPAVFSHQAIERDSHRIWLQAEARLLGEVMVTASKSLQAVADIPSQTLVLDRARIQQGMVQTTADLLMSSGEIAVQKSQLGGGSPILRGFEANKVLLVIDGVRMNNLIFRGGHLQNSITTDPLAMERVEVVFGPAAVLYGSDALGGTIHFMTRKPKFSGFQDRASLSGQALARYSSANNEATASLQLNYGRSKWAVLTAVSASRFGDLRQGAWRPGGQGSWGLKPFVVSTSESRDTALPNPDPGVQSPSGYRQVNAMQKWAWMPTAKARHQLNLQFSTSSDIPRYDRLSEQSADGKPRFAQWYYGPQDRALASYEYQRQGGDWYDAFVITADLQYLGESRHDRKFGQAWLNHRGERVYIGGLGLDLTRHFSKHELHAGMDFSEQRVHSEAHTENRFTGESGILDTRYPAGGAGMRFAGIYGIHTWRITPRFQLQQGLRLQYARLDADFGDAPLFPLPVKEVTQEHLSFDGSISFKARLWEQLHAFAAASSALRVPNVDDLGKVFESLPGMVNLPNPGLEPEKYYSGEIGLRWLHGKKLRLQCSAYRGSFRNAITSQPATYEGRDSIFYNGELSAVLQQSNTARASLCGLHASLSVHFFEWLQWSSTINYTYGRIHTDTTDYPLDHIPPAFGKTELAADAGRARFRVEIHYHRAKPVEDTNLFGEDNFQYATPAGTPGWWVLNVGAGVQLSHTFEVNVGCENIFDRHYRSFASGISAPGRNLMISARASF